MFLVRVRVIKIKPGWSEVVRKYGWLQSITEELVRAEDPIEGDPTTAEENAIVVNIDQSTRNNRDRDDMFGSNTMSIVFIYSEISTKAGENKLYILSILNRK